MKNLGLSVLAIILSLFVGLLGTKVVLSISTLFDLTFLVELGFLKLYALITIFQLVNYKDKDSEEDLTNDERVKKAFYRIFLRVFLYLASWGLSFLMYYILT